MTEQRLVEIRERLSKATPRPWQTRFVYRLFDSARKDPINLFETPKERDWDDADFIANAPEDIEFLLAELAERDKKIAELEDPCSAAGYHVCGGVRPND